MNSPTKSFLRVPYDLRLAKQIERRMIMDALQRMSAGGFSVRNYCYTGMGSIYFVDFILLHRYLGIRKMSNVEFCTDIVKRMKFNQPFRNVDLQFRNIGDVIPTLDRDSRHILWLDYDDMISPEVVKDITTATTVLSPGSLLLITIDVDPPTDGKPKEWRRYYVGHLKYYCNPAWTIKSFARSNLFRINMTILEAAIQQGLAGRTVSFLPLFNFVYADGHEMLTIGGLIGSETEQQMLDGCDFDNAFYIRRDLSREPYRIRKVLLTRKERIYLDAKMPRRTHWRPSEFEMSDEDLQAYSEMYRFFPTYAELLL